MSNAIKITKWDTNIWNVEAGGELIAELSRDKYIDDRYYWTRTATEELKQTPWTYDVMCWDTQKTTRLGEFKTHAAAKKAAIAFFAAKA